MMAWWLNSLQRVSLKEQFKKRERGGVGGGKMANRVNMGNGLKNLTSVKMNRQHERDSNGEITHGIKRKREESNMMR